MDLVENIYVEGIVKVDKAVDAIRVWFHDITKSYPGFPRSKRLTVYPKGQVTQPYISWLTYADHVHQEDYHGLLHHVMPSIALRRRRIISGLLCLTSRSQGGLCRRYQTYSVHIPGDGPT